MMRELKLSIKNIVLIIYGLWKEIKTLVLAFYFLASALFVLSRTHRRRLFIIRTVTVLAMNVSVLVPFLISVLVQSLLPVIPQAYSKQLLPSYVFFQAKNVPKPFFATKELTTLPQTS